MIIEKVKRYLEKIRRENKKMNIFLHVNENALKEAQEIEERVKKTGKKGRLYGYVIAVKSNINVKGMVANCASRVLENYISGYDASVIEKIKKEDGVIIGMTNMDEFAAGGSGENSAYGCCVNTKAPGYIPGGSSSGSAVAVAAEMCDVSLGSDTGGSIRNPASNCGVVGVKPSYGLVSRYGLIDLSMSLDQIGPIARNVEDAALVLDVIKGKDERDTTTTAKGSRSPIENKIELKKIDKLNIGVLRVEGVNSKIQELIDKKVEKIVKRNKWKEENIEIKHINLAVQTYYPLVYAEFFSATRRFDGRRYGYKIEDKCGKEVLRRILGGSEITKAEFEGQYYEKALQVKELIKEEFEKAFEKVDCILLPTVPNFPWKVGEGKEMKVEEIYAFDALTIPANLAEICAVSVPAGEISGIPVGMQIMCAKGQDGKMMSIAKMLED